MPLERQVSQLVLKVYNVKNLIATPTKYVKQHRKLRLIVKTGEI